MNTAMTLGISLVGIAAITLGFVLAIRLKQQFGFLAPLGFMGAALLQLICRAAMLPMFSNGAARTGHETFREAVSKLSDDDKVFYLGLGGQADGIWYLGAVFFLICGLNDLRAASGGTTGKLRYPLIIVGMLLITVSAIYPSLMLEMLL